MFLLGLPTFEARTSRLERLVASGHVQSNALVQFSLGESDGNHSDARAVIMDEGTQNRVGGKECGTYLIVSMQRSASTTFCHDVSLIDRPKYLRRPTAPSSFLQADTFRSTTEMRSG